MDYLHVFKYIYIEYERRNRSNQTCEPLAHNINYIFINHLMSFEMESLYKFRFYRMMNASNTYINLLNLNIKFNSKRYVFETFFSVVFRLWKNEKKIFFHSLKKKLDDLCTNMSWLVIISTN